ncbi:B12-binding domain-containing radical SAM protein [Geobacter sp. SVR]|uniref:B12-binding domain-containing radical SAM protein n=1 Tax=Geobacter sp. SVR TaxID=2495594 RepID=UPI00143F040A|nr:radical SAM protein [Geobacter sp. SVR]BCS52134.1 magnesium-protoporphyrin IX monomethyl ester cyclase [Geobacter sp. SVR]GCF86589.1 magnesium-protoporphyrin IX monomethyl ester cyclase [Geobacter sp. SVR]
MSKILFITAPYHCWGVQVVGNWPPLHMAYLAGAALDAGHEAGIFDAMNKGLGFDDIREEIERVQPDYVMSLDYLPVTGAISTATVPDSLRILDIAKEVNPAIVTLLGGPHPTFMFGEILEYEKNHVDFIIKGEPEHILKQLLAAIPEGTGKSVKGIAYREGSEIVSTENQHHIVELDSLNPAWHLLDWDDYHYRVEPEGRMASILTSRGCDMGCAFCSQRMFWREDWRCRKPENVIEEMAHLIETYQIDYFTLIDAYPTKHRDRWELFLDLLIERNFGVRLLIETRVEDIIRDADILHKYRDAGIIHIYIGAESADKDTLNSLNKGTSFEQNKQALDLCREAGIITEASFMIGFTNETWDSIENTIDSAKYLNPDIAVFPVVTPMPFTPLFKDMKDRIRVWDYSKYNLVTPIVEPLEMTMDEITQALGTCYMRFYSDKVQEIVALEDGFKRRYMLSAFKLMMKDHGKHFDFAGSEMPMHFSTDVFKSY